jgi:hypothetical protein
LCSAEHRRLFNVEVEIRRGHVAQVAHHRVQDGEVKGVP